MSSAPLGQDQQEGAIAAARIVAAPSRAVELFWRRPSGAPPDDLVMLAMVIAQGALPVHFESNS